MRDRALEAAAPAQDARHRLLDTLNPPQRQAVENTEGPLLVLAGAGTGKTRVLTTRIAWLIASGRAQAAQILAVTFTNKAALEMKTRVARLLDYNPDTLWIGTFHALCARMLRRHAECAGLRSNFTIFDAGDQLNLIKQLLKERSVDTTRWPPRRLLALLDSWKNRALTPGDLTDKDSRSFAGIGQSLYTQYQEKLLRLNAVDFGDLLLHMIAVFSRHDDILEDWQRRFAYILVDEYQDTNVGQYLWLRLLAQKRRNLCCVGDEDQSIYGWRGAQVENILRFERDFPGASVVRLEQNYRSSAPILKAASAVVAHNTQRLGKSVWTERTDGHPIALAQYWQSTEEARAICRTFHALRGEGCALNAIAVLVRVTSQMRDLEEQFIAANIPYRVGGGVRFYERAEIRDALAYLRLLENSNDDVAFLRIVNLPRRGVGPVALRSLEAAASARNLSLLDSLGAALQEGALKGVAARNLATLNASFTRWRALFEEGRTPHDTLARQVLEESGYRPMWQTERNPTAQTRLDNVDELLRAMGEYAGLAAFLEHVSLFTGTGRRGGRDGVLLTTLHGAKGLEFDAVFLPGWEEGLFPHQRSLDEGGARALEEERRLAYVGLTRAKRRVFISCCVNRRMYNHWTSAIPSRFLDELPPECVESVKAQDTETADTETAMRGGAGADARPLRRGDRVRHRVFGSGVVCAEHGDSLDVAFARGVKRILRGYVRKD